MTAPDITLRDLYACFGLLSEMMTACLSEENAQALADAAEAAGRDVEAQVARNAFSLADAMLKERGPEPEVCEYCCGTLPGGCGGLFSGEASCRLKEPAP